MRVCVCHCRLRLSAVSSLRVLCLCGSQSLRMRTGCYRERLSSILGCLEEMDVKRLHCLRDALTKTSVFVAASLRNAQYDLQQAIQVSLCTDAPIITQAPLSCTDTPTNRHPNVSADTITQTQEAHNTTPLAATHAEALAAVSAAGAAAGAKSASRLLLLCLLLLLLCLLQNVEAMDPEGDLREFVENARPQSITSVVTPSVVSRCCLCCCC